MMIFIWANKYFIWITQFKTKYSIEQRHSASQYVTENRREIPHSQLTYLKVIDLDQYSLYGGRHTQVNDRFQDYKTF